MISSSSFVVSLPSKYTKSTWLHFPSLPRELAPSSSIWMMQPNGRKFCMDSLYSFAFPYSFSILPNKQSAQYFPFTPPLHPQFGCNKMGENFTWTFSSSFFLFLSFFPTHRTKLLILLLHLPSYLVFSKSNKMDSSGRECRPIQSNWNYDLEDLFFSSSFLSTWMNHFIFSSFPKLINFFL